MKKALFALLILGAFTACGGKKEEVKIEVKEVPAAAAVIDKETEDVTLKGDNEDDFPNMEVFTENRLEDICVIEKVRGLGDPELETLYGDLMLLQEKADEWAKMPRSLEELEKITEEIGRLKGKIEFRSLEVYDAIY